MRWGAISPPMRPLQAPCSPSASSIRNIRSFLVGRTRGHPGRAATASRPQDPRGFDAHRESHQHRRGAGRHRDDGPAHRRDPRQAAQLDGRGPQAARRRQGRRIRLRRQHRRADGVVRVSAQAASRPHAPRHRRDDSRRSSIRSCSSTRARTSTAPPRSSCSSRGSAPSTPRTFSVRPEPSIGLLSNGEESEKGNASVKEAHKLLSQRGTQLRRQRRGARHPHRRAARAARSTSSCATASSATCCSSSTSRCRS